jgi:hypothetical protein
VDGKGEEGSGGGWSECRVRGQSRVWGEDGGGACAPVLLPSAHSQTAPGATGCCRLTSCYPTPIHLPRRWPPLLPRTTPHHTHPPPSHVLPSPPAPHAPVRWPR